MAKLRMERTQHALITEGVLENEQTLVIDKPFWVFFVMNLGIGTWLMGVLVAGMGLDFADAMFVLLLGSIIGSLLPAATATLGPLTRLSQIEAGRFSLGRTGKKIPALLNWVNAIGWDVINNVLSTAALISLLAVFGVQTPFWLALGILVALQLVIGIYGHHLIQDTSKFVGILLGIFFVVIGVISMHKAGSLSITPGTASLKDIFSALALLVAFNLSFAPYAADYTRYLPNKTPSRSVFLVVFSAIFLSLLVLAFFGYMTASTVSEQTPEGVMNMLQKFTGHFSPLVLFLVAFYSIPANAFNDNSAGYSLISAGLKVSRPVSAIFGALVGYVVCLLASNSFVEFFENFLLLFAHGIAPWAAIILVHWFTVGKKQQVTPTGLTAGCIIFVSVTVGSILLFSASSLYTGLLSNAIGGLDVGPYIGFCTAATIYYGSLRLWPSKYKLLKS